MPIREGRAKLWFKTKEEQDEYDDLMISNIELTTTDDADENYTPMFVRNKQEQFLSLNSMAKNQLRKASAPYEDTINYIDTYLVGKRDHTINRYWHLQRGLLAYPIAYLFLRELPIRNFYARGSIMAVFTISWAVRTGSFNPFQARFHMKKDEFTDKDIRNYTAYTDMTSPIVPTADNKIMEAKLWQLNQPAYMRQVPEAKISEVGTLFSTRTPKTVAWDGTFNMPLEGLAHPLHKDNKNIDFAWWEY